MVDRIKFMCPCKFFQIILFDFYSEVYVWVGKMSPPKLRKKAIELAKKHFDAGCK